MKTEILNLTYASSLTDLCEINSSFDSGILRIAYTGDNRNGSSISKDVFESCIKTIYNCPVVCNYDRETDTLGGHDMELVRKDDGSLILVNLTQPIGVVPQTAKVYWETVEEDDGTVNEYLCAEVLIWKRQEAYRKIKKDGITAQSMEITVKDGETINGIYCIKDFEFTAFALIGVEPCYESASLAFSKQDFKQEFSKMMLELKDSLKDVTVSDETDNIHSHKYSMEGGSKGLDKQNLIEKYGIDVNTLDFSIDDFTVEELEEKFKAITEADKKSDPEVDTDKNKFALTSNVVDEIMRALDAEKIQCEWGECSRYFFVDCDFDAMEVYCWDRTDWLLYGFSYKTNGDSIEIDFENKKRKKYVIADFDEGEQVSPIAQVFEQMEQVITDKSAASAEFEAKYQNASETITSMEAELEELRKFKADTETAAMEEARKSEIAEVFAKFEDLVGVEAFENLKTDCDADCMKFELDALEEKCYAIRGRRGIQTKMNFSQKAPKLPIETPENNKADQPYGGLFEEYGFSAKE